MRHAVGIAARASARGLALLPARAARHRLPQSRAAQLRCSIGRQLSARLRLRRRRLLPPPGGRRRASRARPAARSRARPAARAGDCETKNCADGVCCDTACGDACHACNLPDNVGTCVAVARGSAPVHDAAATSSRRRAAAPTASATAPATASSTTTPPCAATRSATRAATPSSPKPAATATAPARRRARRSRARRSCAGPTARPAPIAAARRRDCVAPNACADGSCGPIGNGLPCHDAGQCQSGFCVDGVCCNAPCTEQCMACD